MSQANDLDWVVLPIAKFSHNSCPVGTRNFVWKHVSLREDMDIVFQNSKIADDHGNIANRVVMKIIAGAELLEIQDLGDLVRICCGVVDISSGSEHPVQIVTKSPFLAMRYPQATAANVRRIQVKFRNDADFTTARKLLEELGLPVTRSSPPSNTPSTVSATLPPIVSPATTMFSSTSVGSSSPITIAPSPLPTFSINPTTHLSPTKSLFKVPMRPDSAISKTSRPASNPTYFSHQPGIRSSSAFVNPAAADPFTTGYTTLNNGINTKSQMPSLYLSQMVRESSVNQFSHPIPPARSQSSFTATYPGYTAEAQPWGQLNSDSRQESHTGRQPTISPFFSSQNPVLAFSQSPPTYSQEGSSTGIDSQSRNRHGLQENTCDMIVNGHMPPKRILPFPIRPSSTSSLPSLPTSISAPRTEPVPTMEATAKVTAKVTKVPAPKPINKRIAQRKAPVLDLAKKELTTKASVEDVSKTIVNKEKSNAPEEENSPLAAKSAPASRLASAVPKLPSKATTTKKRAPPRPSSTAKRPKMVDASTQTQVESSCNPTAATKLDSRGSAPDSVNHDIRPFTSPPEDYLDTLDVVIAKYKDRSAKKDPARELWEIPGYAEMDEEERHILLNDFICENLDDPHFLQLLKDTDKAWRKAGLGI